MSTRIRHHFRSNVVGYAAVFIALSGTAWAAATIGPGDIKDNAVRSRHILNNAVRSVDVADDTTADALTGQDVANESLTGSDIQGLDGADLQSDSLTGGQISEGSLGEVPAATIGGLGRSAGDGSCDPDGPTIDNYSDCVIVTFTLPRPARVLLIGRATSFREGGADTMVGDCQLASEAGFIVPASKIHLESKDLTEGISVTGVTGVQSAGSHDYAVDCSQGAPGAIFYRDVGISAVALSPD
jgi:hypothetical protein